MQIKVSMELAVIFNWIYKVHYMIILILAKNNSCKSSYFNFIKN